MDTSKKSTASKISEDQCFEILYLAKLYQLINVTFQLLIFIGFPRDQEML
jgi:hypothetical protein